MDRLGALGGLAPERAQHVIDAIGDGEEQRAGYPIGLDIGRQDGVFVRRPWAVEVVPNPDASLAFPVHQLFLPRNGIYIFENLATEDLARDSAYEFAFFFAPLRLKGASGSPGNPLAIR